MTVKKDNSGLKRGPMNDAERSDIDRLAETLKSPTPAIVARRINRHPSTVFWYMLNRGYLSRDLSYKMKPYVRYGKTVYPYEPKEDARILSLRTEGQSTRFIADTLTGEFGRPRSTHSIEVRLKFLATYENAEELLG